MEGLNIGFISGEIVRVGKCGDNKRELHLRHIEPTWEKGKLKAYYGNSVVWAFGMTAPCGTFVCVPCTITGGDKLERATVFATAIALAKSDKKDTYPRINFAWITGEVVAYEPMKNPNYINIILKSNKRFLKAGISKDINETNVGDYILANCTIGSSGDFSFYRNCKIYLCIKSYINMPKDTILHATDEIKKCLTSKTETMQIYA